MLAGLVWLYAEGKDVQTYPEETPMTLGVSIDVADGEGYMVTPNSATVKVQFRGASAQITRLRTDLLQGNVTLSIDRQGLLVKPGETQRLRLDEALSNELNIEVLSVEPEVLEITVDRLVTAELGLTFNPGEIQLLGVPEITPNKMQVTLPEQMLKEFGGNLDRFKGQVNYADLNQLTAGVEHEVEGVTTLPPALANSEQVTFKDRTVKVRLSIDKNEDSYVVKTVPVWVESPPSEINQYIIEMDEQSRVLQNVKLTGPSDLIARYRDGREKLRATISLSSDDLARPATSAILRFNTLRGVKVDIDKNTVNFTITRRP